MSLSGKLFTTNAHTLIFSPPSNSNSIILFLLILSVMPSAYSTISFTSFSSINFTLSSTISVVAPVSIKILFIIPSIFILTVNNDSLFIFILFVSLMTFILQTPKIFLLSLLLSLFLSFSIFIILSS